MKTAIIDAIAGGLRPALRWPPGSEKFHLLAALLLLLCAAYEATFVAITVLRLVAQPARGDFFALWSAARLATQQPAIGVYDPALLKSAQLALGMNAGSNYPFPYPPSLLLAVWPAGLLPQLPAFAATMGVTLTLYVFATVGGAWRSPMTAAALVLPTTAITLVAGQLAFLTAALLIGGLRLAARRPVAAGVLFGLASYKPQVGMLVPIALMAAGLWRVIVVTAATIAALVAVSAAAFGPAIWSAWVVNIADYSSQFARESNAIAYLMPTVSVSLARLGVSPVIAGAAQAVAAAVAALAVWRCFRRGPDQLAASVLFVATFLATPHAFVYDMPAVGTAVLWTVAERHRSGEALATWEVLVLIAALATPVLMVTGKLRFPLSPLSLALLLAVITRRCLQTPISAPGTPR